MDRPHDVFDEAQVLIAQLENNVELQRLLDSIRSTEPQTQARQVVKKAFLDELKKSDNEEIKRSLAIMIENRIP